eukprot:5173943-Pyramimonas_sp.AAC.2
MASSVPRILYSDGFRRPADFCDRFAPPRQLSEVSAHGPGAARHSAAQHNTARKTQHTTPQRNARAFRGRARAPEIYIARNATKSTRPSASLINRR